MDYDDDRRDRPATRASNMIAGVALIVALTGPLWVPAVWGTINIRSSVEIQAEQNRNDITGLERAVAAADQRAKAAEAAAAALRTDLGRMEQRLGTMREALAAGAAIDLARALRGDDGFARELSALRGFLGPAPDIADMLTAIAPFAETGVPSAQSLRYQFLAHAYGASGASAMAWLRRAISLSAPDPAEATNPNITEADTLLRDDDILGAMAALRRIEPRPAWLDTWLKQASARAAVDTLLPRLDRMAGVR